MHKFILLVVLFAVLAFVIAERQETIATTPQIIATSAPSVTPTRRPRVGRVSQRPRRLSRRGTRRGSRKATKKASKKATKKTTSAKTLSDAEATAPRNGATLQAIDTVNIRSTACTSGRVVGTVARGATATFTGSVKTGCGYTWYSVRGGFVASKFVKEAAAKPSTPARKPSTPAKTPAVSGGFNCGQAYVSGVAKGQKQCVNIDGKAVVTSTAAVFNKMKAAAKAAGVTLRLNSGFRTQAEQQRLYNCYLTKKCNNGNLAARPGWSNHQNGIALDINVPSNVYNWLTRNASKFGFIRAVASETWHWEYRPGSRCNAIVKYSCN